MLSEKMRAQAATEYMFFVALVFVLAATMMFNSFRNSETTIALASARLACDEMASVNSSLPCYFVNYTVNARDFNIYPNVSRYYTADQREALKNKSLENIRDVFRKGELISGNCFASFFYNYCVSVPFEP